MFGLKFIFLVSISITFAPQFIQIEFKDCHKNYDERNLKISSVGINRKDIRFFLKELKNDFGVLS